MRKIMLLVVGLTALGTMAASASAQTATPANRPRQSAQQASASARARTAATAKPTTVRARGKLSAVDETGRMLTVTTTKGSQQFMLASSTHIQEGTKAIDMTALAKLTGHNVTISYVESGGQKTVQSVRVSAVAPKPAAVKTTTSKPTPKKS